MKLDFIFCLCPSPRRSKCNSLQPSPRRIKAATMVRKELGMEHALIHTKAKVDRGMARASQRAARASCRSSCLDVTTQIWICMEDACVSTIRLGSAQMPLMGENVPEGGTCAAGRVAMHLTRRRSTTTRRSDNLTASGPWSTPVRLYRIALWLRFLQERQGWRPAWNSLGSLVHLALITFDTSKRWPRLQ